MKCKLERHILSHQHLAFVVPLALRDEQLAMGVAEGERASWTYS